MSRLSGREPSRPRRRQPERSITKGLVEPEDLRLVFRHFEALEDGLMGLEEFRNLVNDLRLELKDVEISRLFEHLCVDVALAASRLVDDDEKAREETAEARITVEGFLAGIRRHRFLRRIISHYTFADPSAWRVPRAYDYAKSTRENYLAPRESGFVGRLATVRERLDTSWHGNYTRARQRWQDAAVHAVALPADETLDEPSDVTPTSRPWLVYTCGAFGAGKGYVMNYMSQCEILPLRRIVHIDPDRFKQMMPEWSEYIRRDKASAGTLCHRESGLLAELAQEVAMEQRQNLWVDGSLRDFEWHSRKLQELRRRHPHYRVALFYVHATEDTVRRRVRMRAARVGERDVPESVLAASIAAPAETLRALTPLVDFVARIDNETEPVLQAFEAVDTTGDWTKISDMFGGRFGALDLDPAPARSPPVARTHRAKTVDANTHYPTKHMRRVDSEPAVSRDDPAASTPRAARGQLPARDDSPRDQPRRAASPRADDLLDRYQREADRLREQHRRDLATIAALRERLDAASQPPARVSPTDHPRLKAGHRSAHFAAAPGPSSCFGPADGVTACRLL